VNLKQLNRVLMQTLFLPVIALVLVAGVLGWQLLAARRTIENLHMADQNIANVKLVGSLMANEERGIHEYQRTLKETNLEPYEFAMEPLIQTLQKLRDRLAAQQVDLVPIDDLIDLHLAWTEKVADPVIRAARNHTVLTDSRIEALDRADTEKMRAIEEGILSTQEDGRTALAESWQHQIVHTIEYVVLFALFGALILGLFANGRLHLVSDAYQNTMEALRSTAQATYESEQRLRATLTSIGEGVIVCDEDGRIELLNTAAQQLSGWTQAAASHRHMELVCPLIDELTNETIGPTQFTTAAEDRTTELAPRSALLVRSDGHEFFIERSEAPIYDRAGYLTGSVIVISDVTERRRTQSALLSSEKLAVAGRLAATIAHEIHNPLDSVVNLLYMIKQGTTLEEREEFVDMAQSELARVTNISRAMLGMHRESRTPIHLDISAIMHSVLILLERSIAKSGIAVETELTPEAFASGYPSELRQVFTNLLTNAAEASRAGTTIKVTVSNQAASKTATDEFATIAGVVIKVSDHGTGIKPEVSADLLRPFFTTKGEQGSGLGLWISKGIIEKHAGTIEVESRIATEEEPDIHGTTFKIFLPRGTASPHKIGVEAPSASRIDPVATLEPAVLQGVVATTMVANGTLAAPAPKTTRAKKTDPTKAPTTKRAKRTTTPRIKPVPEEVGETTKSV
jgi:PAS domain S-box-containing protein